MYYATKQKADAALTNHFQRKPKLIFFLSSCLVITAFNSKMSLNRHYQIKYHSQEPSCG